MSRLQKTIVLFCLAGSAALVAHVGDFAGSLLLFILAGVVPGTSLTISPLISITLLLTVGTVVTMLVRRSIMKDIIRARHENALPSRRFSSL